MAGEYKKYPAVVLTPGELAWLVKGTAQGLKDYPRVNIAFDPDRQQAAIAIILAESGGNTFALNDVPPDLSFGLAQINMIGLMGKARQALWGLKSYEDLYKADLNVGIMSQLSAGGMDFRPWSTYKNQAYMRFMETARAGMAQPTDPSGKLKTPAEAAADGSSLFDQFVAWINKGALRGASFLGGAALVIGAVVITVKKGVK